MLVRLALAYRLAEQRDSGIALRDHLLLVDGRKGGQDLPLGLTRLRGFQERLRKNDPLPWTEPEVARSSRPMAQSQAAFPLARRMRGRDERNWPARLLISPS